MSGSTAIVRPSVASVPVAVIPSLVPGQQTSQAQYAVIRYSPSDTLSISGSGVISGSLTISLTSITGSLLSISIGIASTVTISGSWSSCFAYAQPIKKRAIIKLNPIASIVSLFLCLLVFVISPPKFPKLRKPN